MIFVNLYIFKVWLNRIGNNYFKFSELVYSILIYFYFNLVGNKKRLIPVIKRNMIRILELPLELLECSKQINYVKIIYDISNYIYRIASSLRRNINK